MNLSEPTRWDVATWAPIEAAGIDPSPYMYMGAVDVEREGVSVTVHAYKHADTRNYLFLSLTGGLVIAWTSEYRVMPLRLAVEHATGQDHRWGDGCLTTTANRP